MARRIGLAAAGVVVGAGLAWAGWAWWSPDEPALLDPRVERMKLAVPGWTTERIGEALAAGDVLPEDVDVSALLASTAPTEAQMVSFHAHNGDVFGGRPYLESRSSVETLLKVHLVRRQLGLPDPPTGIVWPEEAE
jgi:hypothetical protein